MRKLTVAIAIALVCALGQRAEAAVFTFDVLYHGGGAANLAPGSDNPLTTNLAAGDQFSYRLIADPNDFWTVVVGGSFFPLFSLRTNDSATRTANFTLNLLLNGVPQFTLSQNGITNQFVHIGTNTVSLSTGLMFDEMSLQYSLLTSTNINNRPNSLLPYPGSAPEQFFAGRITYTDVQQVPEPTALSLLGASVLGVALRRRKRA